MTRVQMLSSIPIFPTITYSGMIAATIGSILVTMNHISASLVRLIGRSDSANAAGMPSASTGIADTMVANAEFSRGVPMPLENTALNWSSVGTKNSLGVLV